jgi:hypothetical protein
MAKNEPTIKDSANGIIDQAQEAIRKLSKAADSQLFDIDKHTLYAVCHILDCITFNCNVINGILYKQARAATTNNATGSDTAAAKAVS